MQRLWCLPLLCLIAATDPPAFNGVCEDTQNGCDGWAESGECEKNAGFMKTVCPEACKLCVPHDEDEIDDPLLGHERAVLQIDGYGEIVLGFYPTVAPVTVAHIVRLMRLGGYNTNHIFRVDKGFVAQVQGVDGGVRGKMSRALKAEAKKTVPDEFSKIKHTRGMLSMGKFDKPNTGTSSFSMLLGNAPFLDGRYTVFGRVVRGDHVLSKLEQVETKREGIFVMPKERIEISSAVMLISYHGKLIVEP